MVTFMTIPAELRLKIWHHSLPDNIEITNLDITSGYDKELHHFSYYKVRNALLPLLLVNRQALNEVSTISAPPICLTTSIEELNRLAYRFKVPEKLLPTQVKILGEYKGKMEYSPTENPKMLDLRRAELALKWRWNSVKCPHMFFENFKDECEGEAEDKSEVHAMVGAEDEDEDQSEGGDEVTDFNEAWREKPDPYGKFELSFDVAEPIRSAVPQVQETQPRIARTRDKYLRRSQRGAFTTLSRNKSGGRW